MLAVSTAQLVAAVSSQRHNLLRYVPELYCTTVLDMVSLRTAGVCVNEAVRALHGPSPAVRREANLHTAHRAVLVSSTSGCVHA